MKVFIPATDDLLECAQYPGRLVPYSPGLIALAQLQPRTTVPSAQSTSSSSLSPAPTPNSLALPALSSNTYCAGPALG